MEIIEEMNRINKFVLLDSLSSDVPSSSEDDKPIRKLYINNFSEKINRKILRNTFSKYGRVIECIGPFVNVRGYRFAFITYFHPADASKAIKAGREKKVLFNGIPLRIKPSFPNTQPSENHVKKMLSKKSETVDKTHEKISIQKKDQKIKDIDYINQIDDDCLINIFTYLPIIDRMRIERVCKHWQAVSARSWHDIKKLELPQQLLSSTKNARKIKNRAVEKIVERCGRFLTSLNFSTVNLGCNAEVLPIIVEHCKNITRLTLQLRKYPTKNLSQLLGQVEKLQYLEIKDIGYGFKSEILLYLTHDSIEEIRLSTKLSYESFEPKLRCLKRPVFHKLKNLRSLTLTGFLLRHENFRLIAKQSHLTHLSLPNCSVKKHINKLTCLHKLQHLNLTKVFEVSNHLLITLASKCTELRYLNISDCPCVSSTGIAALAKLPNLEVLLLDEVYGVTDSTLSEFVNLHELHCESCEHVKDPGIITLIKTAPNLKYLNIFNTNVTSAVINTAHGITKIRTNNLKLHLKVNLIVLDDWEGVSDPSPLLEIEGKDDTVSDISDEFLYDEDDDPEDFWDHSIDEFDEYDDLHNMDAFDYNGGRPFFIF